MAYCTQDDIIYQELTRDELIQLTDDSDLGDVGSAMITAAIAKADAEIDAYCGDRYTVPFSSVPTIVKGWSATLSAYNLHRNRAKPAALVDRYNKVMSWLSSVSDGSRAIPGATDPGSSVPESTTDGTAQTFRKTQTDVDGNLVGDAGTMDVW